MVGVLNLVVSGVNGNGTNGRKKYTEKDTPVNHVTTQPTQRHTKITGLLNHHEDQRKNVTDLATRNKEDSQSRVIEPEKVIPLDDEELKDF